MPSGCSRVQNTPNANVIFLRRDDDAEYRREGKDRQRVPGQALVPVPKDEVTTMQSCCVIRVAIGAVTRQALCTCGLGLARQISNLNTIPPQVVLLLQYSDRLLHTIEERHGATAWPHFRAWQGQETLCSRQAHFVYFVIFHAVGKRVKYPRPSVSQSVHEYPLGMNDALFFSFAEACLATRLHPNGTHTMYAVSRPRHKPNLSSNHGATAH